MDGYMYSVLSRREHRFHVKTPPDNCIYKCFQFFTVPSNSELVQEDPRGESESANANKKLEQSYLCMYMLSGPLQRIETSVRI